MYNLCLQQLYGEKKRGRVSRYLLKRYGTMIAEHVGHSD